MLPSLIYLFWGYDFTLLFLGSFFWPRFLAVSPFGNSIIQAWLRISTRFVRNFVDSLLLPASPATTITAIEPLIPPMTKLFFCHAAFFFAWLILRASYTHSHCLVFEGSTTSLQHLSLPRTAPFAHSFFRYRISLTLSRTITLFIPPDMRRSLASTWSGPQPYATTLRSLFHTQILESPHAHFICSQQSKIVTFLPCTHRLYSLLSYHLCHHFSFAIPAFQHLSHPFPFMYNLPASQHLHLSTRWTLTRKGSSPYLHP